MVATLSGRVCYIDVTSLLRFHAQPGLQTVLQALQVYRRYVPKESCELALQIASKEAAVAELMCQTMALEAMANIFIQLRPFISYNWL